MALTPMELQTMLSQLNAASREQAIQKEIAETTSSLRNTKILKESDQKSVKQTEVSDEAGPVKNDLGKKPNSRSDDKLHQLTKDDPAQRDSEEIQDPNLGHRVDLLG